MQPGVVATARGSAGPGGEASRRIHEPSAATGKGTRGGERPRGRPLPGYIYKARTAQANGAGAWDPARTRRGVDATAMCPADRAGREGGRALPPEAVIGHRHGQSGTGRPRPSVYIYSVYTGLRRRRRGEVQQFKCRRGAGGQGDAAHTETPGETPPGTNRQVRRIPLLPVRGAKAGEGALCPPLAPTPKAHLGPAEAYPQGRSRCGGPPIGHGAGPPITTNNSRHPTALLPHQT